MDELAAPELLAYEEDLIDRLRSMIGHQASFSGRLQSSADPTIPRTESFGKLLNSGYLHQHHQLQGLGLKVSRRFILAFQHESAVTELRI